MIIDRRTTATRWLAPAVLGACVLLGGCAEGNGMPWGVWYPELEIISDVEGRQTADGAIRTVLQYEVEVESLAFAITDMRLRLSSGAGPSEFDPAAPPEGYTFCHAGHCHTDDGRLVDYEDIEAELADGAATGPSRSAVIDSIVPTTPSRQGVPFESCGEGCEVPRGSLATAAVGVSSVTFTVIARDPDVQRLTEPVTLELTVPLNLDISTGIRGSVGPDAQPYILTSATLRVGPEWLDSIDFSTIGNADANTLSEQVALSMGDAISLDVSVTRRQNSPGDR